VNERPWNDAALQSPLLAELGPTAKQRIANAGTTRELPAGVPLFRRGEPSDLIFVGLHGQLVLTAIPRGHDQARVVRTVSPGETLGEEALLGHPRRFDAVASTPCTVAAIPATVFLRFSAQGVADGSLGTVERLLRRLRRRATRDLLRTVAFFRDLPERDFEMAVDAAEPMDVHRSESIYREGDPSDALYLLIDGLVQIQNEQGGQLRVSAYLSPGDFFGDDDIVSARPRKRSAVAMGECRLLAVPARVFRTLADRNGPLLRQLQRISTERRQVQREIVGAAEQQSTLHVFQDLYRMQMASSLLTIDQDLCVRCGHCTWSCSQVHGVARLVRRGDKMLTQLDVEGRQGDLRNLMLPNSCQHCRNPVCMIDCPTGAIGRDPEGEVFIREELCTGCQSCAKACPWDNIQMAPRPKSLAFAAGLRPEPGRPLTLPTEVAVKCDLCRDYEAPACVSSCPTEAILRLDPSQDFTAIAAVSGRRHGASATNPGTRAAATLDVGIGPTLIGVVGIVVGWRLHELDLLRASRLAGQAFGVAAALGILMLLAYALPKRIPSLWMRRKRLGIVVQDPANDELARSKVRPACRRHLVFGGVTIALVALHSGLRIPNDLAGATGLAFWVAAVLGIFGAVVYRELPRRLTALERRSVLPEDFATEAVRLREVLARSRSNVPEALAGAIESAIGSYLRERFVGLRLFVVGGSIREEHARVRGRLLAKLGGPTARFPAGGDELVRAVVELKILPARRCLTWLLRAWLPAHIVASCVAIGLVALHVYGMLDRGWS